MTPFKLAATGGNDVLDTGLKHSVYHSVTLQINEGVGSLNDSPSLKKQRHLLIL